MKHRSPFAVFFLPFVTFGIYSIVWQVKTKNEMNRQGTQIPTAWLMIVPFVCIWWLWKYCEGAEKVTGGKMSGVLAFVLLFLLGTIGAAILQSEFNNVGGEVAAATPTPVVSAGDTPSGDVATPVSIAPSTPEAAPAPQPAASTDGNSNPSNNTPPSSTPPSQPLVQ